MRKLLNKLFERFGYVHKSKVNRLKKEYETAIDQHRDDRQYLTKQIINGQAKAYYYWHRISKNEWSFMVYVASDKPIPHNHVRAYVTDDFDYGKGCAEELCEMINAKI